MHRFDSSDQMDEYQKLFSGEYSEFKNLIKVIDEKHLH